VPAWRLAEGAARGLGTAADVVLLAPPEKTGGKPRLLVVEVKSGFVGPGLDAPVAAGRRKFAKAVGPFAARRTPITQHLEHCIQAAATAELLREAYPFSGAFDVQPRVCYVDRAPPCPATRGPIRLRCEWRRIAPELLTPGTLSTALQTRPPAASKRTRTTTRSRRTSRA
jgi:hypothetical protein